MRTPQGNIKQPINQSIKQSIDQSIDSSSVALIPSIVRQNVCSGFGGCSERAAATALRFLWFWCCLRVSGGAVFTYLSSGFTGHREQAKWQKRNVSRQLERFEWFCGFNIVFSSKRAYSCSEIFCFVDPLERFCLSNVCFVNPLGRFSI